MTSMPVRRIAAAYMSFGETHMRLYKVSFFGGLVTGYVLGARAGRERYDQIRRLARAAADNPAVQQAAGALQARFSGLLKSGWQQLVSQARSKASSVSGKLPGAGRSSSASGNGHARQSGSTHRRPFAPVDGDQGEHGTS
jgi:hypothetical protein